MVHDGPTGTVGRADGRADGQGLAGPGADFRSFAKFVSFILRTRFVGVACFVSFVFHAVIARLVDFARFAASTFRGRGVAGRIVAPR
ncbi:hypothetical protein [Actinoplanes siamensis]|uniref:Uncharacterized protein n=1 Tax=Actinoplanes siamensis TaxID=1223317 RepID=A0A919N3B0_9ACTN|nr:hypothetical protein [Actinoplanes siamensis]GIF03596.1 hypothetical protein Asi03nite_11340 [Actinoplanes siamensis]